MRFIAAVLMLTASVYAMPALADEPQQQDQAVAEYLKLRTVGKRHHEALSIVRSKFGITNEQLEEAANRISSNGYPETVKAEIENRKPGSSTVSNTP